MLRRATHARVGCISFYTPSNASGDDNVVVALST